MKLYHAGKEEIREPDIYQGRKNADFVQGFYLTPDREFAYRWAYEDYVVKEYELDLAGLDVIRFSREADWFDYIFRNRRAEDTLAADVGRRQGTVRRRQGTVPMTLRYENR